MRLAIICSVLFLFRQGSAAEIAVFFDEQGTVRFQDDVPVSTPFHAWVIVTAPEGGLSGVQLRVQTDPFLLLSEVEILYPCLEECDSEPGQEDYTVSLLDCVESPDSVVLARLTLVAVFDWAQWICIEAVGEDNELEGPAYRDCDGEWAELEEVEWCYSQFPIPGAEVTTCSAINLYPLGEGPCALSTSAVSWSIVKSRF